MNFKGFFDYIMEAKELRIGNLVNSTINGFDLKEVHVVDFSTIAFLSGALKSSKVALNFEGIPLTQEWLNNFGIQFTDDNPKKKAHYEGDILFKIVGIEFSNSGRNGFYSYDIENNDVILEHVHQLQNLYFALTNQELTLNETTI